MNFRRHYFSIGGNTHGLPVTVLSISVDNGNLNAVNGFIASTGIGAGIVARDTANAYNEFGNGSIPYLAVLDGAVKSKFLAVAKNNTPFIP